MIAILIINIRWLKLYSHSRIDDGLQLYFSANDTGNRIYEKHSSESYVHTIALTVKSSITVTLKMCSLSYMMGEISFATKNQPHPQLRLPQAPIDENVEKQSGQIGVQQTIITINATNHMHFYH